MLQYYLKYASLLELIKICFQNGTSIGDSKGVTSKFKRWKSQYHSECSVILDSEINETYLKTTVTFSALHSEINETYLKTTVTFSALHVA